MWVTFHEVPEDVDAFDVSVVEGIVLSVFTVTLNDLQTKTNAAPTCRWVFLILHLFSLVTASPRLTGPAMDAVHVSGVGLTLHVAVHGLEDVVEVDHLGVVVPSIGCLDCVVWPGPEVARPVRREGDGPVVQSVHVDDVERRVRHEVVASQRSTSNGPDGGQRG